MTYPISAAVEAGQATEACQYNDLRNDALCLGNDPSASGTLLDLLHQNMGPMPLSRISKTVIRLSASEDVPCALMIGGKIYAVSEEKTITVSPESFPAPARLSLYAVGAADGSFSIRAGDSVVPNNGRRIGSFQWSGSGVIPDTVRNVSEEEICGRIADPSAANGRLTLVSGNPVPDTDINYGETLYYTPYCGNSIGLYLNGIWERFCFSELSLSLSGLQRGIPYDVFLHADENGLHLSAVSWGTSGARPAGMLGREDGVRVLGGNSGKRYLGSVVLNGDGFAEDSRSGRLLWNENHRMSRPLLARLVTTKTRGTIHMNNWAPYYDEDAPAVRMLIPFADTEFDLAGAGLNSPISESDREYLRSAAVGIGRDMMTESPYTGNASCIPVFTHSCGNAPITVHTSNTDLGFQGYHTYTLAFWANYNFYPIGTGLSSACGECPGLYGKIIG